MKVLDTDHCIAILRGQLDLRGRVAADEELAVTALNVAELTYGAHKSAHPADNLARLDTLLAALRVLPFEELSARRYSQLRVLLERAGQRIGDIDLQIASIALEWESPLVTHNQGHFQRLANLAGLTLEDWL